MADGATSSDVRGVAGRSLGDRLLDPAVATLSSLVLAFLLLPVIVLIVMSFSGARSPLAWGGFSTRWWQEMAADADVSRAATNSLVVAGCVAVLATVLGTTLALGLDRRSRRRSTSALDVAVVTPILLPDVVQGIALLLAFRLAFDAIDAAFGVRFLCGRATIVAAHTAFAASYVTLLVRARLSTIPRNLVEAALDLGATPFRAFLRVQLPLLLPAVVGGAILAFTLSLDEYVLTFFTSGPGSDTLPIWVESSARRGITPKVNAVSAVLVVASIALASLAAFIQRTRKP